MSQLPDRNREYISTSQAVARSSLSKNYFTHLLRSGLLEGFNLGRDWFIYIDSLESFLATNRKPGPKGPRKSPQQRGATTPS
jgi:hypothetical protein